MNRRQSIQWSGISAMSHRMAAATAAHFKALANHGGRARIRMILSPLRPIVFDNSPLSYPGWGPRRNQGSLPMGMNTGQEIAQ